MPKWFRRKTSLDDEPPTRIAIAIPQGWSASRNGELLDVLPPGEVGALQVSTYSRDASIPIEASEARGLVESFVSHLTDLAGVTISEHGEHDAWTSFTSHAEALETSWNVVAKVWPTAAVIGSYCRPSGDDPFGDTAVAALESLGLP